MKVKVGSRKPEEFGNIFVSVRYDDFVSTFIYNYALEGLDLFNTFRQRVMTLKENGVPILQTKSTSLTAKGLAARDRQ